MIFVQKAKQPKKLPMFIHNLAPKFIVVLYEVVTFPL